MTSEAIIWVGPDESDRLNTETGRTVFALDIETKEGWLKGHLAAADVPARMDDLVPSARAMTDQLVENTIERLREQGQSVSCQAGCSFCCKQYLIPMSMPEAFRLWAEIEAKPTARYDTLASVFLEAANRVAAADPPPLYSENLLEAISEWYADLHQPCPLLENNLCSEYASRPLACREFLVTSPPLQCQGHQPSVGQKVVHPVSVAEALYELSALLEGAELESVVLSLLPSWVADNRIRNERTWPAPFLAQQFIRTLRTQRQRREERFEPMRTAA